jgi:hypothetical protein
LTLIFVLKSESLQRTNKRLDEAEIYQYTIQNSGAFMKLNVFLALACLALVFSSCDNPAVPSDSDSPVVPSGSDSPQEILEEDSEDTPVSTLGPPELISPEEAFALLRIDEHPVRDSEELTLVVEDFLSDAADISGMDSVPVITEIVAQTITVNSGFAVKSPGSDTETVPESSELPFYRYTLEDAATGASGVLIASGDKRIGGVIAYIENETDDPTTDPFMDILADRLSGYIDRAIDAYNSVTPADAQALSQNLSRKAAKDPLTRGLLACL